MERRTTIMNFSKEEYESMSEAWERFKLLLHKCPNHKMNSMEQLTYFISGLTTPTWMFLHALVGGTLRNNTYNEVKNTN